MQQAATEYCLGVYVIRPTPVFVTRLSLNIHRYRERNYRIKYSVGKVCRSCGVYAGIIMLSERYTVKLVNVTWQEYELCPSLEVDFDSV